MNVCLCLLFSKYVYFFFFFFEFGLYVNNMDLLDPNFMSMVEMKWNSFS